MRAEIVLERIQVLKQAEPEGIIALRRERLHHNVLEIRKLLVDVRVMRLKIAYVEIPVPSASGKAFDIREHLVFLKGEMS